MVKNLLLFFSFLLPLFADEAGGVSYLKLAAGKAVTVLNSQAAKVELERAASGGREILAYDQMTGILVAKTDQAEVHQTNSNSELSTLENLYNREGEKVGVVIGVERKNDNKILPFGYYRIQYLGEELQTGSFLFDVQKRLVAVLYNSDKKFKNQGYATPIRAVLRGVADYNKNGKLCSGRIGIVASTSGSIPEVLSVRPGQPASKAGVKKGDFLIQVGDKKISNYLEMREAFYYLIAGKPEKFTIIREGVKRELILTPVSTADNG